jgi:hypothetical protein
MDKGSPKEVLDLMSRAILITNRVIKIYPLPHQVQELDDKLYCAYAFLVESFITNKDVKIKDLTVGAVTYTIACGSYVAKEMPKHTADNALRALCNEFNTMLSDYRKTSDGWTHVFLNEHAHSEIIKEIYNKIMN